LCVYMRDPVSSLCVRVRVRVRVFVCMHIHVRQKVMRACNHSAALCFDQLGHADKYGDASTPEQRAKYTKWVVWANAALDKSLFTPDIDRRAPPYLAVLEDILGKKQFLEDEFSVADVAVCSYLSFIPMFHVRYPLLGIVS
jgi:hypothetical protein